MPDLLPCLTYFYAKGAPRPKTGVEPPEPVIPDLTPRSTGLSTIVLWGEIDASGAILRATGIKSVERLAAGKYEVKLNTNRSDNFYIVSRFANDSVPLRPKLGPYSRITDMSNKSFIINWFNRRGEPVNTNFVFGIYG